MGAHKQRTISSELDFNKLIVKCYNYLVTNFHKFSQTEKIRVAVSIVERAYEIRSKQPDTGNTYITQIINNVIAGGGGTAPGTLAERGGRGLDILTEVISKGESVSIDRSGSSVDKTKIRAVDTIMAQPGAEKNILSNPTDVDGE